MRYTVAVEYRKKIRPAAAVTWAVRYELGTVASGKTVEEAERIAAERNEGARRLPRDADPEAICTCRQQRWKCAADEFAAHMRAAGEG